VSLDPEIDSDIPAMLGASAPCACRHPVQGPIGAARVGYSDGKYLLNPTQKDLQTSKLDLVVAGTADAVLMVESSADAARGRDARRRSVRARADAGRHQAIKGTRREAASRPGSGRPHRLPKTGGRVAAQPKRRSARRTRYRQADTVRARQ